MITRKEAIELLNFHIKTRNLIKHCLAVEAVMRKFAQYFNKDEEIWGLSGLLHDLDYEYTKDSPDIHGIKTVEILSGKISEEMKNAILAHCEKKPRETLIEKVLYAVDPTTGFIVAGALIKPEKKLNAIDVKFLLNRFKEKSFARGASREQMKTCEEFGLSLEKFYEISLEAMKDISGELGL
ncbi:HD domain-containing protein [Thermosipho ferrireducens]|uniref:HD domain-containing protein n=1 Tax=Thermosipho ferrireducens TaxID=2571116 RepID=A0ABX7S5U3_9BACT|nr:HD domain-containing protein [Thermosipho ferrireducens]QTA37208.1 HD domain-containing protein [Thermosipho ferrireducens]